MSFFTCFILCNGPTANFTLLSQLTTSQVLTCLTRRCALPKCTFPRFLSHLIPRTWRELVLRSQTWVIRNDNFQLFPNSYGFFWSLESSNPLPCNSQGVILPCHPWSTKVTVDSISGAVAWIIKWWNQMLSQEYQGVAVPGSDINQQCIHESLSLRRILNHS